MTRKHEIWSRHSEPDRAPAAGSPFGETHGMNMRLSCIRCGIHRLPADLQADKMFKNQKRCIDREACATARGGKS